MTTHLDGCCTNPLCPCHTAHSDESGMTSEPVRDSDTATAKAAVAEAEEHLRLAQRKYLRSLEANDRIGQVAFLLYQHAVQREDDWEGPVTWEHWHDLQIEEERDDWRELAAQILALIDGGDA